MKKTIFSTLILIMMFPIVRLAVAQDDAMDQVTVQLTDPSKPAIIELSLVNGGITVVGYEGKDIIVETRIQSKKLTDDSVEKNELRNFAREQRSVGWRAGEEKENKDKAGMTRIPVQSSSLEVMEENNFVKINTDSWRRTVDVSLKVPTKTSLNLHCVNNGDINVENVDGNFEIENINGKVALKNISGSVNAHALNKNLDVIFKRVDADKPMSFSTMNSDIDVTFPSTVKCDVKIKADNGQVYSDYEIVRVNKPKQLNQENKRDKDGKYRVLIEQAFFGTINGGGPEYQFTSFNGDMYIRKAK
ncbi:MAG TPA: hypothetical protein PLP19_18200 [bacterium]|nr:hypothetical protein [bacterium]HPN45429.1 hypothetical protein [bacterium]